jgi:hypothetical protein
MELTRRVLLAVALLTVGCDDSFQPVQDFAPKLVIYGVLDPARDTQYVRVASSYDPPDHDLSNRSTDPAVAGVTVTISGWPHGTVTLQPALIPRWDSTRYSTPVPGFVAAGFRPKRGSTYALHVTSPIGEASASVVIPDSTYAFTVHDHVLAAPQSYPRTEPISFRAILAPQTHAFVVRLLVDYRVAVPGGWEAKTIEIPRTLIRDDSLESYVGTYPELHRRITSTFTTLTEGETFYAGPYFRIIQMLRKHYKIPGALEFIRARAVLYQTDESFYRYVKLANGFNDPFSIRTDEPDVSNIANGLGLFSSVSTDTVKVPLPSNLGL